MGGWLSRGSGGEARSRWRHGSLEAPPSALEIFVFFFWKNNLVLGVV